MDGRSHLASTLALAQAPSPWTARWRTAEVTTEYGANLGLGIKGWLRDPLTPKGLESHLVGAGSAMTAASQARQSTATAPVASAVRQATWAPSERPATINGRSVSSPARSASTIAVQAASSCDAGPESGGRRRGR